MNHFNGIGRMTRGADVKQTKNGKQFARFTIAINRFNDEVDFIDCTVFNEKVVNVVSKYTSKGSQIGVSGSLQINTSEKDGHKFKHPQINVQAIDLLDSKQSNTKGSNTQQNNKSDNPFANDPVDVKSGELPF
ncbi:single-stranded DNA-binding protein [Staphylococcus simulans]|uniref:single-stranded DNA-binding protein n=1 Tax=Staphylococcus simulans TaxID=1286 RepID=UPI00130482F9|nr:single-stranded DNA-binding protein [Staphylococcus simulans]